MLRPFLKIHSRKDKAEVSLRTREALFVRPGQSSILKMLRMNINRCGTAYAENLTQNRRIRETCSVTLF